MNSKKIVNLIGGKYYSSLFYLGRVLEESGKEAEAIKKYLSICEFNSGQRPYNPSGIIGYYTIIAHKRVQKLLNDHYPEECKYEIPADIDNLTHAEKKQMSKEFEKMGKTLHRKYGLFDRAFECFDFAIKLYPKNSNAIKEKGLIYGKSGNSLEALKWTLKAIEVKPSFLMGLHNTAVYYSKLYNTALEEEYSRLALEKYSLVKKKRKSKKVPQSVAWRTYRLFIKYLREKRIKEAAELLIMAKEININWKDFKPSLFNKLIEPLEEIIPDEKSIRDLLKTPNDKFYQTVGTNIQFAVNLFLYFLKSNKTIKLDNWSFDYDLNKKNIKINFSIMEKNKPIYNNIINCTEETFFDKLYNELFSNIQELIKYEEKGKKDFDRQITLVLEKGISSDINYLFSASRNRIKNFLVDKPSSTDLFELAREMILFSIMISPLGEEISYPYIIRAHTIFRILRKQYPDSNFIKLYNNLCFKLLSRYDLIKEMDSDEEESNLPLEIRMNKKFILKNRASAGIEDIPDNLENYNNILSLNYSIKVQAERSPFDLYGKKRRVYENSYDFKSDEKYINNLPYKAELCNNISVDSFGHGLNQDGGKKITAEEFRNLKYIMDVCKQDKAINLLKQSDDLFKQEEKAPPFISAELIEKLKNATKEEQEEIFKEYWKKELSRDTPSFKGIKNLNKIYNKVNLKKEPWYLSGFKAEDYIKLSKKGVFSFYKGIYSFRAYKYGEQESCELFFKELEEVIKDSPVLKMCQLDFKRKYLGEFNIDEWIELFNKPDSFTLQEYTYIIKQINHNKKNSVFNDSIPPFYRWWLSSASKIIDYKKAYKYIREGIRRISYYHPVKELVYLGLAANGKNKEAVTLLYNECMKYPYVGEAAINYILHHYSKIDNPQLDKEGFLKMLIKKKAYFSVVLREKLGDYLLSEKFDIDGALSYYQKEKKDRKGEKDGEGNEDFMFLGKIISLNRFKGNNEILNNMSVRLETLSSNMREGLSWYSYCKDVGWSYLYSGDLENAYKYHKYAAESYSGWGLAAEAVSALEKGLLSRVYNNYSGCLTRYQFYQYMAKYLAFFLDIGDNKEAERLYRHIKKNSSKKETVVLKKLFKKK